jgi:DNA-binding MarR family transcriptional regulator
MRLEAMESIETYAYPGHLIRRLHQISTQVFMSRVKDAGFDVTQVQFAAMQALKANPGIEQAQIASLIAYDRATIGGVVDRLEKKGYITRVISKSDRRAREVNLSETGSQALEQLTLPVRALQDEILENLDAEERAIFISMVQKVTGVQSS